MLGEGHGTPLGFFDDAKNFKQLTDLLGKFFIKMNHMCFMKKISLILELNFPYFSIWSKALTLLKKYCLANSLGYGHLPARWSLRYKDDGND